MGSENSRNEVAAQKESNKITDVTVGWQKRFRQESDTERGGVWKTRGENRRETTQRRKGPPRI